MRALKNFPLCIVFILFFFFSLSIVQAEKFDIRGKIQNGTTGQAGSAENIKLILLDNGMENIAELQNVQSNFIFQGIDIPKNSPILLQAIYSGVKYNKLIPPTPQFRNQEVEVIVYDISNDPGILQFKSILHIVRDSNFLIINKFYLIENTAKPLRSFVKKNYIEVYVPQNAKDLYAKLTPSGSKMGIPLNLQESQEGKLITRPILPGLSELQISYTIQAENLSDVEFEDKLLLRKKDDYRVVFYKPQKMKVEISNFKELFELQEDLPENTGAYKVYYPEGKTIKIRVSGGSPVKNTMTNQKQVQRKIINGTWFYNWDRSLLGVVVVVCILFLLSFIFVFR